jgi:phosphatidate phosphatase APP1
VNQPNDKSVSDLKPIHQARLFPSLGYYDAKRGYWRALVHGRVFIDGRVPMGTRILLRGLKRAMQATPEDVASETFRRRIDGFLAAPGKRRRIVLDIAGHSYQLRRRTRKNGAFYGTLRLPDQLAPTSNGQSKVLQMDLLRSSDPVASLAPISGSLHLVQSRGLSVVSDIDDTIKRTEATSKREMLANTFLRPFEVVEGMSQLYQAWQAQGCDFHYVSSSPWQLYEPLAELCEISNFPPGSMHLRYFRVRDEMFKRFRPIRRNAKVGIIIRIIKALPNRKFILVGDSGEKDPEIYRFLAKRFPANVAAVLIRNLAASPLSQKRSQKLLALSDVIDIKIFDQADQIADVVSRLLADKAMT